MKKLVIIILVATLGISLVSISQAAGGSNVAGHKIVIDAGHGGSDPGSTACLGYPEKDANFDIALQLRELLERNGATVYMTREEDDETLSNSDRYTRANNTDGEVLVSIHLNGSSNPVVNGTQGLYGKRNKDKAFTGVIHTALWEGLKATPNFIDFGVTNFASGVLLKSNMPATIQEAVFISNTEECLALRDGDGTRQWEIAQALYDGLNEWFGQTGSGEDGNGGNGGKKCESPPCGKSR